MAILYVNGIKTNVMNAGKPSVKSLKSISSTEEAINTPTIIRAGAVAALGIIRARGAIKRASKNRTPVVTAVKPVRPPSPIPAALST